MDNVASTAATIAPKDSPSQQPAIDQRPELTSSHRESEQHEHPSELPTPPRLTKHATSPPYDSPARHHRRTHSTPKQVKESLNARSEYVTSHDDGVAEHRINQYIIKQEIGRGSFGAVHLAVDQYGTEYAVKEFSKARLRKRAQSHILRKPFVQRKQGSLAGFNSPLHRNAAGDGQKSENPPSSIDLIKEEIAIMKKLNHPNLVTLIEVLDDPSEDSLYMVMEMCKKGVVMRVGLEERADPYPDDTCRYWFRDLMLGIEYLHAQGVVHRDIKPDNCLVTDDDVLKIVDFGVSEMFEKDSEMKTAKSAGSPAFLPPELCVARHGDISGKAADIWSMGVTLYCLKYGRIPFEKTGIVELYESIKVDQADLSSESDQDFRDLMSKILEKHPAKRIKMPELRNHPWVTKRGSDPLLSEEENVSDLVELPTEAEMNAAITHNMRNLMTVVKAVNKFKALTAHKRQGGLRSILGDQTDSRFSHPPAGIRHDDVPIPKLSQKAKTFNIGGHQKGDIFSMPESEHEHQHEQPQQLKSTGQDDLSTNPSSPQTNAGPSNEMFRVPTESSTDFDTPLSQTSTVGGDLTPLDPGKLPPFMSRGKHARTVDDAGNKGHAHDPLEDQLYLFIGPSTFAGPSMSTDRRGSFMPDDDDVPVVSESPGAADVDIYETAYRDEIERILARAKEQQKEPNVYLTRRVDEKLMAVSGLAGKWMAVGEEARNQIRDYTQFSTRKAKVTEVSRALREAAKDEYDRRKQERRDWYAAAKVQKAEKAEKAKAKDKTEPDADQPSQETSQTTTPKATDTGVEDPPSLPRSSTMWKGKAVDKGRQAGKSFMGLMDAVKNKSRTKSKDDSSQFSPPP